MAESVVRTTVSALARAGALKFSDGYRTKKPEHGPGLPILRVGDIEEGAITPSFKDSVREEFRPKMAGKTSRSGDVLLTTKGTVGRVALVPDDLPEHVYSPQLCFLRVCDKGAIDPYWLYAWVQSAECQAQVHSRAGQTDMAPYLSLADLKDLSISMPPIAQQQAIAGTLQSLDGLIELDAELVKQLDRLLMATWAIAARDCPSGPFGAHGSLSKGVSYKGEFLAESGLPLINLGNFGRDGSFREDGSKNYKGPVKSDRILRHRDLVVANTDLTQQRDILARPLLVPYEEATSTHHTFQVRVTAGEAMTAWLYCALRVESVRRSLIAYSTGTTVAALPADALVSVEVPSPGKVALDQWWARAEVLLDSRDALILEARQVRSVRDELLPLVMSGRVRPGEVAS